MKTIKTYLLICMAVFGAILLFPSQNTQAATAKSAAASGRQVRVDENGMVTVDFDDFSTSGYTFTLTTPKNEVKKITPTETIEDLMVNGVPKAVMHATINASRYAKGLYTINVASKASLADHFSIRFYNYPGISATTRDYASRSILWNDASAAGIGMTGEKPFYMVRYYTNSANIGIPNGMVSTKFFAQDITSAPFLQAWQSGTFYATVTPYLKTASNLAYYGPTKTCTIVLIGTPQNVTVKETGYQKATVSWKKVPGATSYVVKNRTLAKSYTVASSKTSLSLTGLTAGKTHNFVVYAKNGTKTSEVSATASFTATKASALKVTGLKVTGTKGNHTITWDKVTGAAGYRVSYKKSGASSYTELGTTTGATLTTKKLSEVGTYVVLVKPYTLIGTEKVNSTTSTTVNVTVSNPSNGLPIIPSGKIRTIGFYSRTTKSASLYNTYTSTNVAKTLPAGTKVEQIDFARSKYGNRCLILYSGKQYFVKRSLIKSYAEHYTTKKYTKAEKETYINQTIHEKAFSKTKYLIWISHYTQNVTIFTGSQGNWKVYKSMDAATGRHSTRSPMGYSFVVTYKEDKWDYVNTYESYVTHYAGRNSFHTRVHSKRGGYADATINRPASHGCARLYDADAKFIYQNMPKNTRVISW